MNLRCFREVLAARRVTGFEVQFQSIARARRAKTIGGRARFGEGKECSLFHETREEEGLRGSLVRRERTGRSRTDLRGRGELVHPLGIPDFFHSTTVSRHARRSRKRARR